MIPAAKLETLHPSLLARARELDPLHYEDMLQDAYVLYLEKRPRSRAPQKIKHWFRRVLEQLRAERLKDRSRQTVS